MVIRPINADELRDRVRKAVPFPFFSIDNFLELDVANEVERSFPTYTEAQKLGREFAAVNEKRKIQITDSTKFPSPILRLHEELASPEWLGLVSYAMEIPKLLADPTLAGGGIHETGARAHLDVHIDFNYHRELQLHRRLNILVYFNKDWRPEWGGNIELWDREVKVCHQSFSPIFNRCVVFETSDISYHGVSAVKCPEGIARKSFAAYYYTKEAPPHWKGEEHSTIFKARPNEVVKGKVLMPLEDAKRALRRAIGSVKSKIKRKM